MTASSGADRSNTVWCMVFILSRPGSVWTAPYADGLVPRQRVRVAGVGLRAPGRVERGHRVGLVLGEQQFALALGEPGAGVRPAAVRRRCSR